MIALIDTVMHVNLCSQIVEQFAFMKLMAEPEDKNYSKLMKLSLDNIFESAKDYFDEFKDEFGMLERHGLENSITTFLCDYRQIVDVLAIQQDIHYKLQVMDKK